MSFLQKKFKYSFFYASIILIVINFAVFALEYAFPNIKFYCSLNIYNVIYRKDFFEFVSYMFIHADLKHIVLNMFALFMFALPVERAIGSKEFLILYFVTGVISGLLSFLVYVLTNSYFVFLMGASGAVYAVLLLYSVIYPKSKIYVWGVIPLRAPVLVLIYAIIEIVSEFIGSSNVAHLTHLFGFIAAFTYVVIRFGINPVKVWKESFRD